MIQNIRGLTGLLVVVQLGMAFGLVGNTNLASAQDQGTATNFSDKGSILPLTVINPKTGEYVVAGTWNLDVNKGKVTNFTADMQVELYNGSNPHSHQFMNFRQAGSEVLELDSSNSGEIKGIMDLGLNNNIVHSNVKTNITLDRGVLITITPDIHDLGIQPTIYGIINSTVNNENIVFNSSATNTLDKKSPLDSYESPYGHIVHMAGNLSGTEIHHYCKIGEINNISATCLLFDDDSLDANFIGIEFAISKRAYLVLPEEEKPSWHDHDKETITQANLSFPELHQDEAKKMMKVITDTYGKQITVWNPADRVPPSSLLPQNH
jgi:hypothetical protein